MAATEMPMVYRYYEKSRTSAADGTSFRGVRSPGGNFLTKSDIAVEKISPSSDKHSRKDIPSAAGVLHFLIISVRHRHFYCFGANRIKIAKSVQKIF